MIDRLAHSNGTDFIILVGLRVWPGVFNIADVALVVALVWLCVDFRLKQAVDSL